MNPMTPRPTQAGWRSEIPMSPIGPRIVEDFARTFIRKNIESRREILTWMRAVFCRPGMFSVSWDGKIECKAESICYILPVKNKTVLITGSTDGIGVQTALELAKKGARILIHGRNPDRAAKVVSQIESAGGQAQSLIADLSSMADVKKLAAAAAAAGPINVLINNAGVFMKEKKLTVDGFETTFAVNHLAVFLLTNELLPSIPDGSRIITLSSIAHKNGKIDFDNLQSEKSFDGYAAYAMSKLCNVVFSYELARRAASRGILSNAVHPGVIQTKLLKEGFNMDSAGSLEEGAATSIYLASSPEVQGVTGKYFVSSRESVSSSTSRDEALQRKLWDASEQMLSRF